MNNDVWVQSIYSKNAKKWRVASGGPVRVSEYVVYGDNAQLQYLPKSEYAPCEPPERWVNVTDRLGACSISSGFQVVASVVVSCEGISVGEGYRVRKAKANLVGPGVPHGCEASWVLILEKKV